MSNLTISNLPYLIDLKYIEKSARGGFLQGNNFGLGLQLKGRVNQVTVANAQGNSIGGDTTVVANAQANLAFGKGNKQGNFGGFSVYR